MKKLLRFRYCLLFVTTLFISLFVFHFNLEAIILEDKTVSFKYNDEKVRNTINKDFLGDEGYLEQVRKQLSNTSNFTMFFTKDDIIVFYHDRNNASMSMSIYYNDIEQTSYMTLKGSYIYDKILKLSDFENFTEFLSKVGKFVNYKSLSNTTYHLITTSKHKDSKLNKSYDYLDSVDYDYIIPYYNTQSVNITIVGSRDSTNYYNMPFINNVSGFNTLVGLAYNLYGYNLGELKQIKQLFSVDYTLTKEDLEKHYLKVKFNVLNKPNLTSVQVLGRVHEGNIYHWEDITYQTGKDSYYAPDYLEPTFNNGVFMASFGYGQHNNLDKYDLIYIKFYFENAKNVINVEYDGNYIRVVYFNDLSQFGIFDRITTLNMYNAHIFTTKKDLYNEHFYYLDNIDFKNNLQSGFNFFSTDELKIIEKDKDFRNLYYSIHEGDFVRIPAGTFGTSKKLGLYTYMRNGLNGSLNNVINMKYYYTPLDLETKEPILYVSQGVIADNRFSMDLDYVDSDGNLSSGTIYDKFEDVADANIFYNTLMWLLNLFLPTGPELESFLNTFEGVLSRRLGFIWEIVEIPVKFISGFIEHSSLDNTCLEIPQINEPLTGYKLMDSQSLCFSIYREKWSAFFVISDFIISGVVTVGFICMVRSKFKKTILGGIS